MRKAAKAGFFISLSLMIGCARVPFIGKPSQPPAAAAKSDLFEHPSFESSEFVEKGRIVDAQRLRQGQNIVIFPFTAGINVEATGELDKIALMIVKGVSDAFADDHDGKRKHFNILTNENSEKADLIIRGHVVSMESPSKVRRWVLLKGKKALGVEGKMTDAQTGEIVLNFSDHAQAGTKKEDHPQLGYRIGRNIGQFILSGIQ